MSSYLDNLMASRPVADTTSSQTSEAFNLDPGSKSLSQFASDDSFMLRVRSYTEDRFGDDADSNFFGDIDTSKETNEDYLQRFLSHIRSFENNSVGLAAQVDWQRGASDEQRKNFGSIYAEIDEKLPNFYEEGGSGWVSGLRDYLFYNLVDPINVVGAGVGKVVGRAGMMAVKRAFIDGGKEAAQQAASKFSTKEALGTAAAVGTLGAVEDVGLQSVEQGAQDEFDPDYTRAGIVGGLGFGIAGGLSKAISGSGLKKAAAELGELEKRGLVTETADAVGLQTALSAGKGYTYNPTRGKEVLDALQEFETGSADEIVDIMDGTVVSKIADVGKSTRPGLDTALVGQITRFAVDLVRDAAEEGVDLGIDFAKKDMKASEIVRKIFVDVGAGNIDSDLLQRTLRLSDLSEADFADATGASLTAAATQMSQYSQMGKLAKKLASLDPSTAKMLDAFAGKNRETESVYTKGYDFVRRLDRERRALMVTQLSTTARNTATGLLSASMGSMANVVESTLYHAFKGVNKAIRGDEAITISGIKSGWRTIVKDSFGTLAAMDNTLRTKELSNALLKHNPRLARLIDRSMTELEGTEELSKFARVANSLNIAQDVFLRRAVFTDSVEKQLRRQGIDLVDLLEAGKNPPISVLQKGVDEALEFTFSRMPKPGGGRVGDGIGNAFIKITEALPMTPIGTGAHPFARFMVNAMQFQFEYSPLNFFGAAERLFRYGQKKAAADVVNITTAAGKRLKEDTITDSAVMLAEARKKFSQGTVGSAALVAAIKYRSDHQEDLPNWYDIGVEGSRTVDMRPFFPVAPYLLVADVIVKLAEGNSAGLSGRAIYEGLTGSMARTGLSSYVADGFFKALQSEGPLTADVQAEKLAEATGKYLAEIGGAAFTPIRIVNDIIKQFDADAAVLKDSNAVEGQGVFERGLDAFIKKSSRNIPFLEQTLPDAISPITSRKVMEQSPIMKAFFGPRFMERKRKTELQLMLHGYEAWQVVPSTGDKAADRYIKKFMGPYVESYIGELIETDYYQNLSRPMKRETLKKYLEVLRKEAKALGSAEADMDADGGYTPFDRSNWMRLRATQRLEADAYFVQRYGRTVMEMQQVDPDANHVAIGVHVAKALTKKPTS